MAYLEEIVLLCVVGVNIISLFAFCMSESTMKHSQRKMIIRGIVFLLTIVFFDVVCMVGFAVKGSADNLKVFVLFFPLIGYYLYDSIKELTKKQR
ncbi:MAG: hypothetical protein ACI4U9_03415 [Clostridia bacterium]